MDELNECCSNAGIDDLHYVGHLTTWSKGSGRGFKARKLDRVLVNHHWLSCFPEAEACFAEPGVSDHSPVLVNLGMQNNIRRPPFRFFSYWADHPQFEALVSEAWNSHQVGSFQYCISRKLKYLKAGLKILNNTEFANLSEKTSEARNVLMQIQGNLLNRQGDEALKIQETLAMDNLIRYSQAEESFLK